MPPKQKKNLTSFFEIKKTEEKCVKIETAKSRWTNLRDLFRRELKKTLKVVKETGDPNAHEPRWRHFKSMLFLKDQIVKDDISSCLQYDESLYPQTILEDESGARIEDDSFVEDSNSNPSYQEKAIVASSTKKRAKDGIEDHQQPYSKRHHWEVAGGYGNYEDCTPRPLNEMDEDYHFLMSILPSVRRIRQDRKTSFKMKVLQLILEEENVESEGT
ncbi:uncharacterized protein LOC129988889 isoform X2 [Argiope bruennichi]|uniref:uncharacterized protein LOC129988889 isoform X2 n=1 Tax=Argiope bruennichi TaxID=94029 RepID=UPI0024957AD7|nr:uncharacterized protein LOC129988889 isoform X2 [Argiope bruennichi]